MRHLEIKLYGNDSMKILEKFDLIHRIQRKKIEKNETFFYWILVHHFIYKINNYIRERKTDFSKIKQKIK